jgi:alpha-tubulin suppressor-like RCC1 family protein
VHNLDNVKVSTVACGWRHSVAATSDGRLFTWGWSKYGQLGHGDNK